MTWRMKGIVSRVFHQYERGRFRTAGFRRRAGRRRTARHYAPHPRTPTIDLPVTLCEYVKLSAAICSVEPVRLSSCRHKGIREMTRKMLEYCHGDVLNARPVQPG